MRVRNTTFIACALVAATGLVGAPAAMATGTCKAVPSIEVTTDDNNVLTPCAVISDTSSFGGWRCANPKENATKTGILYKHKTNTHLNHVAVLVTANNLVVSPPSTQVIKNCVGDPVTLLGKRTCHENAVKINGVPATQKFWVVVDGAVKMPLQSTIATKPTSTNNRIECFSILGLGLDSAPVAGVTETLSSPIEGTDDKCAVEFTLDSSGANVLSSKLTPDSHPDCDFRIENVEDVLITIGGGEPRKLKFGQGYLQSGLRSCTTRVIGGRVYSWGNPCPD